MWISNFSIRNPVVTTVVMLALSVFGGLALMLLDTDEYPDVEPPVVAVSVVYPGASPQTVEREVIEVMEEAFSGVSGLRHSQSQVSDGFGLIVVEFAFGKDLQEASQDLRDKISEIRADLPIELEEPVLRRFDPQNAPIVSLALSSPKLSTAELTRIADPQLTSELHAIEGVANVTVVGGAERELTVELDPHALQAAGIGIGQVAAALGAQNLAAPVGRVTGDVMERTIRLRGRLNEPRDFERLVVGQVGGKTVRLGQIAAIRDGAEELRSGAFFNDERAVAIEIVKATGYSTTAVANAVRERIAELQDTLPESVMLRVVRDSGVRVEHSVRDVETSLIAGAVLTVLVVFLFLRSWRSTVITGLALPVSVLASFTMVLAFGFTLNTMSLLGLSLAIGILIDDAIVVRENIVRHIEMGKDHVTAAREGTAEIGLAVAATTFSIVAVFVPIAFMGGVAQQWFAPFALTIASSVLVSLLVSFSLDPMLSSIWADPAIGRAAQGRLDRVLDRFNHWVDSLTADYKRVVGWALRHRLAMTLIALGSFAGALALPALDLVGSEFFPEQDRSQFTLVIQTPPGSSLKYTEAKALLAASIARRSKEVVYTAITLGGQTSAPVDEAHVYVRLVPKRERSRSQHDIAASMRSQVSRIGGATALLSQGDFGLQRSIQVELTGPDLEILMGLATRLEREVKQVEGAVDVGLSTKGQKPEFEVVVDRELAGDLGVTVGQVAQALRPAFAGIDVGDWIDPGGETRDVTLRLAPEARQSRASLENLPLLLTSASGATVVPLSQVARVQEGLGPAQIDHRDRRRVVRVEANTSGRPLSQVVDDIDARVEKLALPPGYKVRQGGDTEDQDEVFTRIMVSLGAAVLLMYLILVIQFASFLDPIPIMASLPLSLIGVMLALLITNSTLNLMSMIGVILLMGIVAKNAILLVDFAKLTAAAGGRTRREALIEAGGVRLRPILMTSLAVIAGMMPIAIGFGEGADSRAPLGRAVIGGVITSTLLTLLVIPTFYDMLADGRERMLALLRSRSRPGAATATPAEASTESNGSGMERGRT
jgi:hydrophobic/amphiphilic exporter-1 (mainly G- bacteria), HAE1 family